VNGDRARGALLYALSAVLLLGGGVWFFRAAPTTGDDPRVASWRRTAAQLLPDLPFQVTADTIVMAGDVTTERSTNVGGGSYTLSMVCLGDGGHVRVRLSSVGDDSGRAVACTPDPASVTLNVALAADFFMLVSGETGGATAVFRWRLDRARGL
jgi:Family of unknown function (DUF6023)